PRPEEADEAVLAGDKQHLEALLNNLDASLMRHGVRQSSLDQLKVLGDWLGDELVQQLQHAIAHNLNNQLTLDRLHEAQPFLAAYQSFRGRASQLAEPDLELLALLRQRQEQLDGIAPEQLEAAVR